MPCSSIKHELSFPDAVKMPASCNASLTSLRLVLSALVLVWAWNSLSSFFNLGQMTTPTFGSYTYCGSGLLAAKCMSAVCHLFSIVVRGPLLRLVLPHTVGAVFWPRKAWVPACRLFSIVVRGALLRLEFTHTVGATLWPRIAWVQYAVSYQSWSEDHSYIWN